MKTTAIEVGSAVKVLPAVRGCNHYAGMTGTVTEISKYGEVFVALNEAAGSTLYTRLDSLEAV